MADAYRACRQFERFLGYKGAEKDSVFASAIHDDNQGRLVCEILYFPDSEEIKYKRPSTEKIIEHQ